MLEEPLLYLDRPEPGAPHPAARPEMSKPGDITRLLAEWSGGDERALAALLPRVHGELKRLAAGYMRRERREHTLQASALVNEAYLRLVDQRRVDWRNRAHFFAVAASMMRRILVDHARRRRYQKRGGGWQRVTLEEAAEVAAERDGELLRLDEALEELAKLDPEQVRLVELRYFGGLKNREIEAVLGISDATITRRWRRARAWLYRRLRSGDDEGEGDGS